MNKFFFVRSQLLCSIRFHIYFGCSNVSVVSLWFLNAEFTLFSVALWKGWLTLLFSLPNSLEFGSTTSCMYIFLLNRNITCKFKKKKKIQVLCFNSTGTKQGVICPWEPCRRRAKLRRWYNKSWWTYSRKSSWQCYSCLEHGEGSTPRVNPDVSQSVSQTRTDGGRSCCKYAKTFQTKNMLQDAVCKHSSFGKKG